MFLVNALRTLLDLVYALAQIVDLSEEERGGGGVRERTPYNVERSLSLEAFRARVPSLRQLQETKSPWDLLFRSFRAGVEEHGNEMEPTRALRDAVRLTCCSLKESILFVIAYAILCDRDTAVIPKLGLGDPISCFFSLSFNRSNVQRPVVNKLIARTSGVS